MEELNNEYRTLNIEHRSTEKKELKSVGKWVGNRRIFQHKDTKARGRKGQVTGEYKKAIQNANCKGQKPVLMLPKDARVKLDTAIAEDRLAAGPWKGREVKPQGRRGRREEMPKDFFLISAFPAPLRSNSSPLS